MFHSLDNKNNGVRLIRVKINNNSRFAPIYTKNSC